MQCFVHIPLCVGLIFFISCTTKPDKSSQEKPLEQSDSSGLIWSDEFDQDGLPDPKNWVYDVGNGCEGHAGCGWGNNEDQYYTEADSGNARVSDGRLIIKARKEKIGNSEYSSARILTKGKLDQRYGRFEIRAKLPYGRGTWPAIWMLPSDRKRGENWPRIGEIDIMEHVGYKQGWIFGTIHTEKYNHMRGTQKVDSIYIADAHENFYTYAIEWTKDRIDWYVDDKKYHSVNRGDGSIAEWPFDKRFHLILNIAVGGNWGGKMGIDDRIWPQTMEIDYVRVYDLNRQPEHE
jgi:beta-glucanase (GH16 family)